MPRAEQTREVDFILRFFRTLKAAKSNRDYSHTKAMIAPDALLRTAKGEARGMDAVLEYLKTMEEERYHMEIVAPKGGVITMLVAPLSYEGLPLHRGHEQVYHIRHGQVVELTDIGRTPQQVYRPESQPN